MAGVRGLVMARARRLLSALRRAAPTQVTLPYMEPVTFVREGADRARFQRLMRRPAPNLKYVIYFTPRSGSSRITDICQSTRTLAIPGEIYSPANFPEKPRRLGAYDLDEYVDVTTRLRCINGMFGCEMTFGMIRKTFGTPTNFIRLLGGGPSFWLIRKNIVAQGVSLSIMKQSKISHAKADNIDEVRRGQAALEYDAKDIKDWVRHVLNIEERTEEMFIEFGIDPLRISYEDMAARAPNDVANVIAQHLGVDPIESDGATSSYLKIGTKKNNDFVARFEREEAAFLRDVARRRRKTLDRLADPASLGFKTRDL